MPIIPIPQPATPTLTTAQIKAVLRASTWQLPVFVDIDYIKSTPGPPTGTPATNDHCLNTNEKKLYHEAAGVWDAGAAVADGDRFIWHTDGTDTSGDNGSYTHTKKIYTYENGAFTEETPTFGWICWVEETLDLRALVLGGEWISLTNNPPGDHDALANISGGAPGEYNHITDAELAKVGNLPGDTTTELTDRLKKDGSVAMTGNLNLDGYRITNLPAPGSGSDPATRDYVDSYAQGVVWKNPVIDNTIATPPGSPTTGDRYIVAASPTGAWTGHEKDIATWNGSAWTFGTPSEGWALRVTSSDKQLIYNGSVWVEFGTTTSHAQLQDLQGGTSGEYNHLSDAELAKVGNLPSDTVTSLAGKSDTSHTHAHSALTSLSADDHAQYALLAGRAGGQVLKGGTASGESMTIDPTAHSTKGEVNFVGSVVFKDASGNESFRVLPRSSVSDETILLGDSDSFNSKSPFATISIGINQFPVLTTTSPFSIVAIGHEIGLLATTLSNEQVFIGWAVAASATSISNKNSIIGSGAVSSAATIGNANTVFGHETAITGLGSNNTVFGAGAGGTVASSCIFIGRNAGAQETNSNRLAIAVSNTLTPLIYGEFDNKLAKVHGALSVATGEKTSFTTMARVGGNLLLSATSVGNVGSGEDDLISQSLPAAALSNNGESVEIEAWGTFAANANTKNVKQYFGSTVIFATGALLFTGSSWRIKSRVVRTGATAQVSVSVFDGDLTLLTTTCQTAAPAATLANAVTIKCTGEATSNDDIVQLGQIVKFLPA